MQEEKTTEVKLFVRENFKNSYSQNHAKMTKYIANGKTIKNLTI